ncbi:MAG: prepilin-type N-terminal cleavage/methylation domain-containing protein [Clostridia bacterium]|nr:prepilin-type N-terminal cleavage/methylation domain-containing protein [Clostridia bacterium]
MKKLNKKGFTIVELVIVIAVIAILAAVLIPTFATVIQKANESAALQAARNAYTEIMAVTTADLNELGTSIINSETAGNDSGKPTTATATAVKTILAELKVTSVKYTAAGTNADETLEFVVNGYTVKNTITAKAENSKTGWTITK